MTEIDLQARRNAVDLHAAPGRLPATVSAYGGISEVEAELAAYRAALDRLAIVAVTDRAGVIVGVNELFCTISQYASHELIGRKHNILNSGHHPPHFFKAMWKAIGSGEVWRGDICNRAKHGSLYWVDTTIVPKRGRDGRINGYVAVRYDITSRKMAEAGLIEENRKRHEAEMLLRDIIDAVPNGISAHDAAGRLVLFNSSFRECYPLAAAAIREGASFEAILRASTESGQFVLAADTPEAREAFIAARLHDHRHPGRRFIQQLRDGRWLQVQERRSRSGYIVGVRTDVSELKNAERQIKQYAEHDALTGLFNRRVALERLGRALGSGRQSERLGALVLLDLDGFKAINDTRGHDAGDALLVAVAERLKGAVRKTDVVARLGGDEFALILTNLNVPRDAERLVGKLQQALAAPVRLGGRPVLPSASLGVALFPRDGTSPSELMKNADLALYEAKASGRSTYAMCSPELLAGRQRRASLTQALRAAIARGQIEVALQPQQRMADGTHTGFEALVRWKLGRRPVPPPEMIKVAEDAGLIVTLGYVIIDRALGALRALADDGLRPGHVAINVAADQLREPDFCARLCELVARHRLTPQDVEIEVTENVVLERAPDRIAATLHELHQAGVAIALDDFGTGYASLSHITRFPIDRLKIDRSFVRNIVADCNDAVIVRTVISLAHSLGMTVVAEGVETGEQCRLLAAHGCDFVQGYLLGRPMSPAEARAYLHGLADPARLAPVDLLAGGRESQYSATH